MKRFGWSATQPRSARIWRRLCAYSGNVKMRCAINLLQTHHFLLHSAAGMLQKMIFFVIPRAEWSGKAFFGTFRARNASENDFLLHSACGMLWKSIFCLIPCAECSKSSSFASFRARNALEKDFLDHSRRGMLQKIKMCPFFEEIDELPWPPG